MLLSSVLAILVFIGFTIAQSGGTTANSTIDPNSISLSTRSSWCASQLNTCGTLCSGSTASNTCDPCTNSRETSLDYGCTCSANNSVPGVIYYMQTIPTFICEQIYSNCISDNQNNAEGQLTCINNESTNCGHLDPANFVPPSSTTGTSQTTTSSSTSQTTSSSTSQTTSSSTSKTTGSSTSQTTSSSTSQTTSSPTSQTLSATRTKSSGLSKGAIAGIAIGVAVSILIFALALLIVLRRRRRGGRAATDSGKPIKPSTHELNTSATIHEGITKDNTYEMGDKTEPGIAVFPELQGNQEDNTQWMKESGVEEPRELDPKSRITELGIDNHLSSYELEAHHWSPGDDIITEARDESVRAPSSYGSDQSLPPKVQSTVSTDFATSSSAPPGSLDLDDDDTQLSILKHRMERIREEKYRLEKIQELKELEEQTKAEILAITVK
ncbi:hypothetical protein BP6252_00902 [Coleophoma cylindrospora]|uniref:DUF7707 domain-containing protein n=1 Tax=Coleophoma cylindrospora TaxID=1849047 RepID=A0A3D8SRC6_9HELO|nr:hypothetical protein BP6252_00902 [Coleophoma cylindrospora]